MPVEDAGAAAEAALLTGTADWYCCCWDGCSTAEGRMGYQLNTLHVLQNAPGVVGALVEVYVDRQALVALDFLLLTKHLMVELALKHVTTLLNLLF
jgi:hypothetical protein